MSHVGKHGNDRQYQITGTDYVGLQTKAGLFDSGAPDCWTKLGPSPELSSSINSFLLFPHPAHISSEPCSAVTSKLLFGYDRLSGNRPFPPALPKPLILAVLREGREGRMAAGF